MTYKVQKPCKVCGKMYTPCSDCERDNNMFHWRTVACSLECGKKYFKMVEEARTPKETPNAVTVDIVENITEDITKKKTSRKRTQNIEFEVKDEQEEQEKQFSSEIGRID